MNPPPESRWTQSDLPKVKLVHFCCFWCSGCRSSGVPAAEPHLVLVSLLLPVLSVQKLQEVAFPRKDELKKRLEEKYSREHSEYLRAQVSEFSQY